MIKESVKQVLRENEENNEEHFWNEIQNEMFNVKDFSTTIFNTIKSLELEDENVFNDAYALEQCVNRLSNLLSEAERAYKGKLN